VALISVPSRLLEEMLDPYGSPPWEGSRPFAPLDVHAAAAAGQLTSRRLLAGELLDFDVHVGRVAYLMGTWRNDGSDPPALEVLEDDTLIVNDGYHRICAAIARGAVNMCVDVAGYLDSAEELFGVTIA
jgi:hypothetical protein